MPVELPFSLFKELQIACRVHVERKTTMVEPKKNASDHLEDNVVYQRLLERILTLVVSDLNENDKKVD